jgi:hypothetical protein
MTETRESNLATEITQSGAKADAKPAAETATVQSVIQTPSVFDAVLLATAWITVQTSEGRTL